MQKHKVHFKSTPLPGPLRTHVFTGKYVLSVPPCESDVHASHDKFASSSFKVVPNFSARGP